MKWFGRKAAPGLARPPLARAWFAMNWSGAGAWPQGYDAQIKAAMLANPVAQRAVRLVSEAGRSGGCGGDPQCSDAVEQGAAGQCGAATRALGASGESGVVIRQPDLVQGATSLALIELPGDGASAAVAPLVYAAATGADAGWRRAALFRYRPELESAEALGVTAARAVLGVADTALADGAAWRMDLRGSVEVVLDHAGDALVSLADALLIDGANLCEIGDELLQFGQAEPLGAGRYRLSRLIRGRLGTEWACASHGVGERFVMIDAARLAPLSVTPADVGTNFTLRAVGSGDAVPVEVTRMVHGRAMMPPSPVHGRIVGSGGDDRTISWVRRSRMGWGWADMADVPLGEEREAYGIAILANGGVLRSWESAVPLTTYAADALAADLAAAGAYPLTVEIRQRGTWGLSPPLILLMT